MTGLSQQHCELSGGQKRVLVHLCSWSYPPDEIVLINLGRLGALTPSGSTVLSHSCLNLNLLQISTVNNEQATILLVPVISGKREQLKFPLRKLANKVKLAKEPVSPLGYAEIRICNHLQGNKKPH